MVPLHLHGSEVKSLHTVAPQGVASIFSKNQVEKAGRTFFSGGWTQWPVLG